VRIAGRHTTDVYRFPSQVHCAECTIDMRYALIKCKSDNCRKRICPTA